MISSTMIEEIRQMEKVELHCHLDGSLPIETVQKLAKLSSLQIPEGEQLRNSLKAKHDCENLVEYLNKFSIPLQCLVSEAAFRMAAEDVLLQAAAENVSYMELRFAPLSSATENLSARSIIEAVLDGADRAKQSCGIQCGVILCGMRHMPAEDNAALVRLAAEYIGHGVCAVDLAGDEAGYPVLTQKEMFEAARRYKVPFTIHAGECGSAKSIWDALQLGAPRVGHGIAARTDKALMQYCANHKICFEMCPTSNLQTKAAASAEEYPLLTFLEQGIPISINTDNRTVSDTTLTDELIWISSQYGLTVSDLKAFMKHAKDAAFYHI